MPDASHHTWATVMICTFHLCYSSHIKAKRISEGNEPKNLINNDIDFPTSYIIISCIQPWIHCADFNEWNQIATEQKGKPLRCDLIRNKSQHRVPCSERKHFTSIWLPVFLWFIIPYLISLITSTLHLTISQNTSDKRDLRVMLMSWAGCLLRNAGSRLFCHQWNSNRLLEERANTRLIYVECGLRFYPHTERLQ